MRLGYRGRFAPSPSGALHFGSLVAAVASYLDARQHNGEWLVRIEDLDRPRVVSGAADGILRALDAFGMHSDGTVVYQSSRLDAYHAALHRLRQLGVIYPCACSRREIVDSAIDGIEGKLYPGTCRPGIAAGKRARSWRIDTQGASIAFKDALYGHIQQELASEVGDFVLYRGENAYAYQLAVVVDDAEQGVTDIVRGADLLDSTARQIYLQGLLNLPRPRYLHVPVALDRSGEKISKQKRGAALKSRQALPVLIRVLRFLGHDPPAGLEGLHDFWQWAIANWSIARLPRTRAIKVDAE